MGKPIDREVASTAPPLEGDAVDATGAHAPRPAASRGMGAFGRRMSAVPAGLRVVGLVAVVVLAAWGGFAIRGVLANLESAATARTIAIARARWRAGWSPHDPQARLGLAYTYATNDMPDSALTEYDTVLHSNPNDPAALYGKGTTLLVMGRESEGVAELWRVLARDEGHVRAASALGEYYAKHRQYRSLLVAVRQAAQLHPDEGSLQSLMGLAYENLGHADWAAGRYELALKADPGLPSALDGLKRLKLGR